MRTATTLDDHPLLAGLFAETGPIDPATATDELAARYAAHLSVVASEAFAPAMAGEPEAVARLRLIADRLLSLTLALPVAADLPERALDVLRRAAWASLAGRTSAFADSLTSQTEALDGQASLPWAGRLFVELAAVWTGLLIDGGIGPALAAESRLSAVRRDIPAGQSSYLAGHLGEPGAITMLTALHEWAIASTVAASARLGQSSADEAVIPLSQALARVASLDLDLALLLGWLGTISATDSFPAADVTAPAMPSWQALSRDPVPAASRAARRAKARSDARGRRR